MDREHDGKEQVFAGGLTSPGSSPSLKRRAQLCWRDLAGDPGERRSPLLRHVPGSTPGWCPAELQDGRRSITIANMEIFWVILARDFFKSPNPSMQKRKRGWEFESEVCCCELVVTTIWSRSVFHSSVHTYFRAGGKCVLEINRNSFRDCEREILTEIFFSFTIVSFIQGPASLPACLSAILRPTRGRCLPSLAFPKTNF